MRAAPAINSHVILLRSLVDAGVAARGCHFWEIDYYYEPYTAIAFYASGTSV